jgi:NAD(P)-dependent dehydrogenase (short-subunit alcohol dehydrogenase family)
LPKFRPLAALGQQEIKAMNTQSQVLAGKVAIVTGASKGIGAAIAKHLADAGAAVVVNYASSKAGADAVVAEIATKGGKTVAVQADVAKKSDVERLFAEAKEAFGALDILVNNAGVYEFLPLEAITEEHFHRLFDLNVLGLILCCQQAVDRFGDQRRQHHQHQLGGKHVEPIDWFGLQRYKGRRRRHQQIAGKGARTTKYPRQCH